MKRRFTAMLFGSLSLVFLACGTSSLFPQPEAKRTSGAFFAFGTSQKFNEPNSQGVVPCDEALKILSGSLRPTFVTLFNLDGDDWRCVGRFAEGNPTRPHEVRVYLFYDVVEQPTLEELRESLLQVRHQFGSVANDFSELSIVLTLEDRLSDEQFRVLTMELERGTTITIERNPLDHGADSFGRGAEAHGRGALCAGQFNSASQDGFLFSEGETLSWIHDNANCERLILWDPRWQGLCVVNGEPYKCVEVSDRDLLFPNTDTFQALAREASL